MKRKLKQVKTAYVIFSFSILSLSQAFTNGHTTVARAVQSTLLNVCILAGIYAFRGFSVKTSSSWNSTLVSFFIGSLFGALLASIPIVLFFEQRISLFSLILTGFLATFVLSSLYRLLQRILIRYLPEQRILVIGKEKEFSSLFQEIQEASFQKIKVSQFMNPSAVALTQAFSGRRMFQQVVVADPELAKSVEPILIQAKHSGEQIIFLPTLVEKQLERIPIQVLEKFRNYYELVFENVLPSPAVRVLDIFISLIALTILSPIMLLVAAFILLEDGKPVIFKQQRTGWNGKPFTLYKFRSMKNEAKEREDRFATQEQHRILKIGRIIRPIRLDEVPQFWNILRGTMSLVGPRPEQIPFVEEYSQEIPFYTARHSLKPGLSGWAQISYRYAASSEETRKKLSYDLFYVKNRNLLFDLRIALQTLEAVFWRKGAK